MGNGDASFTKKDAVRDFYLDFLQEPPHTPRRLEKGTGLYQDYLLTLLDGTRVHLIVLDVRYDYEVITKDRLGARQEEWFREAM